MTQKSVILLYNGPMNDSTANTFVNRLSDFYTQQYGLAPVVGRTLGYLSVCTPAEQSINDIAENLQVSRTAVVKAVRLLERYHLARRERPAGSSVDLVCFTSDGIEKNGFDATLYQQQAQLAREGLEISDNLSRTQHEALEKIASLGDFLAERVPRLLEEWQQQRIAKKKEQ